MVSLFLAVSLILGSPAVGSVGMDSGSVIQPQQDVSQNCQIGQVADLATAFCDASDDATAQQPSCPMLGLCLQMNSGAAHCGLVPLTNGVFFEAKSTRTEVFLKDTDCASSRLADPIFHPPIL